MRTTKLRSLLAISSLLMFSFAGASAQTQSLNERFDTVPAPNLPLNWDQQAIAGNSINWMASTTSPNSAPNAAFANEPPTVNARALRTPAFFVTSTLAHARFRTSFNLEAATGTGFDGVVLEISIGGTAYVDIEAAGGNFVSGGYTRTISTQHGSPIAGRRAWSGNSGGYITCTVRLPPGALLQFVSLRWVIATDETVGGGGIWIDDVQAFSGHLYTAPFDFDGDFRSDIGIFRSATAEWWVNRSTNGSTFATQFGTSTDILTPGDFTGDSETDIGFWRPSTGFWFILRSEDFSFFSFPFGASGDIPAPADFDGDRKSDPAVFRPSTSTWFINRSTGGTTITTFGANGDKPVPADYDGDNKADIAIYRPNVSEWWLQRSNAGLVAFQFGFNGDKAVPGDFTGDRKADVAVWRPATGSWFILRSEDLSFYSFPFGSPGDFPVQGDYDGDGKVDAGVFRPSVSTWFINRSSGGTSIVGFGAPGDTPISGAFVR